MLHVNSPKGSRRIDLKESDATTSLADLLQERNLALNTRCGKRGNCDGCLVELVRGTLTHIDHGNTVSSTNGPRSLHACQHRPAGADDVEINVPPRSLLAYKPQVVSDFRVNVSCAASPLWQRLQTPDQPLEREALAAWFARLLQDGRPVRLAPDFPALPQAAAATHDADGWRVEETLAPKEEADLGVAIDLGTTTVAVLLVDLQDGRIVSRAADFNQQMRHGDDVLTRINLCLTDDEMLERLRISAARETILPLVRQTLKQANARRHQVRAVAVAGNTTMLHLLAGVDPSPMGMSPFTPNFLDTRRIALEGLACHTHLLPGAAAYVGADICAGILSSGLLYDDGPSLLVDAGTNGEIVLKYKDRLLGCATAAGPAFEGSGLKSGVRAGEGAISHLRLDAEPFAIHQEVIGQDRPMGLCGSAYIDFLAQGRRVGLLTPTGRFSPQAAAMAGEHWQTKEGYPARLRLADGPDDRPIVITEPDIARLLAAKAAIAAGIVTLLEQAGIDQNAIQRLYLAGGFGMHMNVENAIACGLLPGFAREQVQLVGNTSLAGAYLGLLDSSALEEMGRIGKQLELIELNLAPGFEDQFIDQLSLP